jgi:hypothetical protein
MDGKVTHFSAWCLVLTEDMQPQGYFGADCVAARCHRQVALAAQLGHARAACSRRPRLREQRNRRPRPRCKATGCSLQSSCTEARSCR